MNAPMSLAEYELIVALGYVVLGSIVTTLIFRLFLNLFFGIKSPYLNILKVVVSVSLANYLISLIIRLSLGFVIELGAAWAIGRFLSLIIGFFLSGFAYGWYLRDSSGIPIGLFRGFLLNIATYILIAILCGCSFFLLLVGMLFSM
ncbi:MAG: hypothetical protein SFY68_12705 [Candidatus Sumerlaeia bacterium]|nr:hypothetical protein [Candidatus Sumerlaeia bacterium]